MGNSTRLLCITLLAAAPARAQGLPTEQVTVTGDRASAREAANDAALGLDKPLIETPARRHPGQRHHHRPLWHHGRRRPHRHHAVGLYRQLLRRGRCGVACAARWRRIISAASSAPRTAAPMPRRWAMRRGLRSCAGRHRRIYGAGKVGGLVNFLPKTAGRRFRRRGHASPMAPIPSATPPRRSACRWRDGWQGCHAYGEMDDSFSFYRGLHPSHQLLELSATWRMDDWQLAADYMFYAIPTARCRRRAGTG